MSDGSGPKILIATVGTSDYRFTHYRQEGTGYRKPGAEGCRTVFSPVATARLLLNPEAGERVRALILCTEEARKKNYEALATELRIAGCDAEPIAINMGRTQEAQFSILEALAEAVPDGARVTADFTLSLRHLGLAFMASLAHLAALRDAIVETVAYGAYELKDKRDRVPLLDVTALFKLMEWSQAARAFTTRGDLAPILELRTPAKYDKDVALDRILKTVEKPLEELNYAEHAGLPLETGIAARSVLEALGGLARKVNVPAGMILDRLRPKLEIWALPSTISDKSTIVLDDEELIRQLRLVEHYLDTSNPARALRLLREWLVNLVIARTGTAGKWLNRKQARLPAEHRLRLLEARKKSIDGPLSELGSLWSKVSQHRNNVAHAAFTKDRVGPKTEKVRGYLRQAKRLLNEHLDFTTLQEGDHLLVTPLGFRPGVLLTVLAKLQPDRLLVLTSLAAQSLIPEALERATFSGSVEIIKINESHSGYEEVVQLLAAEDGSIARCLNGCAQVTVNLTGGTTLLGWFAEEIAAIAMRNVPQVLRVASVDRRSIEEQKREPWVQGELVELEPPEK